MEPRREVAGRSRAGIGLLLIGMLALGRAWCLAAPPPDPRRFGEPLPLALEALAGGDFRLLPGVGPVLAERLEAARVAAGGRLTLAALDRVPGVGPALRRRWAALGALPAPGAAASPAAGDSPVAGALR